MKKLILFITIIFFSTTGRGQYNYLHIESNGADGPGYESDSDSFYSDYGVSFRLQAVVFYSGAGIAGYNYADGAHELVSQVPEGYQDVTYTETGGYTYNIYTQIYGDAHAQVTATW